MSRGGRSHESGAGEGPDELVGVDIALDDLSLSSLAQELRGLGTVEVPAAARERTWALMRQELEQRPATARVAATAGADRRSSGDAHGLRRWALGSVALVTASALALAVAFGGFNDDDQSADTGSQTTQVAEGAGTTGPTPGTQVTPGSDTTGGPVTSVPTGTSGSTSTAPDTSSTGGPVSTTVTPSSDAPPATSGPPRTNPPTTKPPTTTEPVTSTTTGERIMTREQRISSATAAAEFVADKVINGDLGGASSVLAGSASSGLVQMSESLQDPYGRRIVKVTTGDRDARVLIEIKDRVDDGQGGVIETARRFYMEVRIDEDGAGIVTAIYKAPSS